MMNAKRTRGFFSAAALAALIGIAPMAVWAQESDPAADQSAFIQRFDQDGDGKVSINEFPGEEGHFNRLDIDADGYLDTSEAPPRPPHGGACLKDMLAELDVDDDGQLSAEEFPGPAGHFDRLDIDGDGFLSAKELIAGRPGPPADGGFEKDDVDADGRVSQAEFSGPADLFDRLDADGDGYVTSDEARSGHLQGGPEQAPKSASEQQ